MNNTQYVIRRTTATDWRDIRTLRLEMIRDTPIAYAENLADASKIGEDEWRARGDRGIAKQGISIAAITDTGQWIGTMGGFVPDSVTGPLLVGVYVAPAWRGNKYGITDALLTNIEQWARTEGETLTLHVHEDNSRARKYYERRGFSATGQSIAYNLDESKAELEMIKQL